MYARMSLSARPLSGIWRVPPLSPLSPSPQRPVRRPRGESSVVSKLRTATVVLLRSSLDYPYPEVLLTLRSPLPSSLVFFEHRSRDLVCPISALLFSLRSRKTEQVPTTETRRLPPLIRQSVYASSLLSAFLPRKKSQIVKPRGPKEQSGIASGVLSRDLCLFSPRRKRSF